jgi:hypothetical protein
MNNYKRSCLICGIEFNTYKKNKMICPGECRKKATALYAKDFMKRKRLYEKDTKEPGVLTNKESETFVTNVIP